MLNNKYFNKRVFVTASLGNTHGGNIRMAKKLIVMAKKADCDAVKFKKTNDENRKEEFWKEDFDQLDHMCRKLNILWYVSVYNIESLQWMEKNYPKTEIYKIPSCKLQDLELIENISKLRKTTFMSTGMSTEIEVGNAINTFLKYNNNLILMHCSSIYPAEVGDVNLRIMRTLHKHFNLHTGYDSHDVGCPVCLAAVGMGAKSIEKHLTLNRTLGMNHVISMEPCEMEKLVKGIRGIEKAFGGAYKKLLKREIPFRSRATGESEEHLNELERER